MKILDTLWFNGPHGCMGIVLGENEEGERKAYVGLATGTDEKNDARILAAYGAPVMPKAAEILFRHFNPPKVGRLEVAPGEEGDGGSFRADE